MDFNVNSPSYFKDHYGIDNKVYKFFQEAHIFFLDKQYSDSLQIIGVSPIVAPKELYDSGAWKESIQLIGNKSCAILSLKIDFEEYYNGDSEKKILLTKESILKALKTIHLKVCFDFDAFEQDLNTLNIEL